MYLGFHDFVDDIQSHDREWMASAPVIDNLLQHLSPEANSDSQRNAAQILSQAAQAHRLPLSQRFASQQFLSRVFELAFSPNVSMEVTDCQSEPISCFAIPFLFHLLSAWHVVRHSSLCSLTLHITRCTHFNLKTKRTLPGTMES